MQDHSFVIPAYKDSSYLEACVQSLLNQTVGSEIVITTSTPSAFTEGIAKKYNLPYFVNDAASSIATDWNFAMSRATSKLVTIAHQDDIYEPLYVQSILEEFDGRPTENILIAFTSYQDLVNNRARAYSLNALIKAALLWPFWFSKSLKNKFLKKSILAFGDPICCPAVTINLAATPHFKFSTAYSCALDWLAWIELAKQEGSFIYIDKKLVKHRIHLESETTNQISNGKRQQEELQLFEMVWGKKIANLISKMYTISHRDNLI